MLKPGALDIVHIRFFHCVVSQDDPTPILNKAMKMLKPGGWIQWTEQDLFTSQVVKASPEIEDEHTRDLLGFILAPTQQW